MPNIKKVLKLASKIPTAIAAPGVNLFTKEESAKMRSIGKDFESRLPISKQFSALGKLSPAKEDAKSSEAVNKALKKRLEYAIGRESKRLNVRAQSKG